MSAAFSIEKPTVVASLPKPLDRSAGRYVVSEVHGGKPGSRKRKRSELVVGVDGEGLNIYNTQTSKLVTSYALPPQSSFTCPPCSVRLKTTNKNQTERRTYVSTRSTIPNLTLFHDSRSTDGATTSAVKEKTFEAETKPIIYLMTLSRQNNEDEEDLLLVFKNGEIQCLDGIDLKTRWVSPASTIGKNTPMANVIDHEIRFAHLTDAYTAKKKLLKGREDIFTMFPYEIDADKFNPHLLVIITSPKDATLASARALHVVALPLEAATESFGSTRSVQALLSVALPKLQSESTGDVTYNIQAASGILHELNNCYLRAIDLSSSQPKIHSQLYVENATSFLPLSYTSVVTASKDSLDIYNRKFQSIQATLDLPSSLQSVSRKRKIDDETAPKMPKICKLVAFSSQHSLVHAIAGNDLLAFHIDSRQDTPGRRRAFDLLIDTLGCGILHGPKLAHEQLVKISLSSLGAYVSGSDASLDMEYADIFSDLDHFVLEDDVAGFEKIMAGLLGIQINGEGQAPGEEVQRARQLNGIIDESKGLNSLSSKTATSYAISVPQWMWPMHKEEYPDADPRFVQYALSRIFTRKRSELSNPEKISESQDDFGLFITFFPANVVHWLLETGNLNHTNIHSALRHDGQINIAETIPVGNIIDALVDVDPELKMLFSLISNTYLDAVELLYATRLLMKSLELLGDGPTVEDRISTNGDLLKSVNGELETEIEIEQEKAATALSIAESYLGDSSSIRGQALSLALAKLHACPTSAVVSALRSMLTSAEIISVIYLLRFELARGAWTSRYLDMYENGGIDNEYGQESTIILVSGLLNCCIDAIGAGGWLSADSMLAHSNHFESEELIQSLKLEVSAALEGIEEASYLKGLIGEMVRYGEEFQKSLPAGEKGTKMDSSWKRNVRPTTLPHVGREARLLPFGLKSEKQVSLYRVGAGGEIQARTARDIGRLKSKKVGKYSREQIEI